MRYSTHKKMRKKHQLEKICWGERSLKSKPFFTHSRLHTLDNLETAVQGGGSSHSSKHNISGDNNLRHWL